MGRIPYKWLILGISVVGVFMSVLDSTIVNIAVPSLLRSFHAHVAAHSRRPGPFTIVVDQDGLAVSERGSSRAFTG